MCRRIFSSGPAHCLKMVAHLIFILFLFGGAASEDSQCLDANNYGETIDFIVPQNLFVNEFVVFKQFIQVCMRSRMRAVSSVDTLPDHSQ